MIHDIRQAKPANKFGMWGTDSVRDAQFCPTNVSYFTFAAAYDNGNVQTWDLRFPGRFERQFMAHSGPVFSLDWHNSDKDKTWWLATAGRDKSIKRGSLSFWLFSVGSTGLGCRTQLKKWQLWTF